MDAVWDGRLDGSRDEEVVGFGDRFTGRGNFGGEFGARNCKQWGLSGATRPCSQIILGRHVADTTTK